LINLYLEEGSNAKASSIESFYFFLRFNVRFLNVLLQTIQPELEVQDAGEDLPGETGAPRPGRAPEMITVITRRVLPAFRQYSIWLVSRALIIIATVRNQSISVFIQEMWRSYANVLTKLIHIFPVKELPIVNYLLEEDEATVGFMPFREPSLPPECNFYSGADGLPKPRSSDTGIERNHPNIEMKARIRDILFCTSVMQQRENFPIELNTSTLEFTFSDDSIQSTSFSYVATPTTSASPKRRVKGGLKLPQSAHDSNQDVVHPGSVAATDSHQSMDTDMHRMVDDLLGPSTGAQSQSNETSYGMHDPTANEIFASVARNGYQVPHINTQGMLPSLPGIWSSPFTPQPNELPHHSPKRESFGRNISPIQLVNSGQQDGFASYKSIQNSASGTANSRRPSNPNAKAVNSILQESLVKEFVPMSITSSSFTNSSSIYANTPQGGGRVSKESTWGKSSYGASHNNNTTAYGGAGDFERNAMLQSSIWENSQPSWGGHIQTPPGGQRG
jgi:hypothetical protein